MTKSHEIACIDLVFENCDSIRFTKEQNVKAALRVAFEDHYAELFMLDAHNGQQYTYNQFYISQRASFGRVEFDKSALNKKTEWNEPCGSYIKDKEVTHINIMLNSGDNYYISVPYRPINNKYGLYNLYQKETVDGDTMILTFTKNNLWGNLPNAIKWQLRHIYNLIAKMKKRKGEH